MATYTLIPSSLVGGYEITDASNAYYDTSHLYDYANVVVTNISGEENAYLGGFDFSLIPSGSRVTNLIVKLKADVTVDTPYIPRATLVSGINGVELSNTIIPNKRNSGDPIIYTFDLTASVETIMNYASSLCIRFTHYLNYTTSTRSPEYVYIYGAEIIVTYLAIEKNKIIYGNETLIDLTGDTATASDVVVGKIFHLASGVQTIGEYVPSVYKKTARTSSSTDTTLAFTDLTKEPSFFVALPTSSIDTSFSGTRVICFLYDGETTYRIYARYSNGATKVDVKAISASFTYSSGTLTVKSSTSVYILAGSWNLFYI